MSDDLTTLWVTHRDELLRNCRAWDEHQAQRLETLLTDMDPELPGRYLLLLDKWSQSQRLVGWKTSTERSRFGLLPSFAGALLLDPGEAWLDLGSGAGLPGLAFAMLGAGSQGLLVDARRRRVAFLEAALRHLDLDLPVAVQSARVEAAADLPPGTAPCVFLSRALAPPSETLALVERLELPAAILWLGEDDARGVDRHSPVFRPVAQVPGAVFGGRGAVQRYAR